MALKLKNDLTLHATSPQREGKDICPQNLFSAKELGRNTANPKRTAFRYHNAHIINVDPICGEQKNGIAWSKGGQRRYCCDCRLLRVSRQGEEI